MIYDGDHFIDGVDFNDLEAAKQDAFSTLSMWLEDAMATWSRDRDGMPCPTPEQIEDHDYMICNFRVYVRELVDPDAEDEDDMYEEIWSPSYEDENRIGWLEWSEARPWYEKQIAAAKAVGREE